MNKQLKLQGSNIKLKLSVCFVFNGRPVSQSLTLEALLLLLLLWLSLFACFKVPGRDWCIRSEQNVSDQNGISLLYILLESVLDFELR